MASSSLPSHSLINHYCTVSGLQSESGKKINGLQCFVVKPDPDNPTTRVAVFFTKDIGNPKASFLSLKPENLTPINSVEVRPSTIPAAGLGLFATRDFAKGEVILIERRMFCVDDIDPQQLMAAVRNLSVPEKEILSQLSTLGRDKGVIEWGSRIVRNRFLEENALYPLMCRINHSCLPRRSCNVWWEPLEYPPHRESRIVTARRDIKAGEELMTNYRGLLQAATMTNTHDIPPCTEGCGLCVPSYGIIRRVNNINKAKEALTTTVNRIAPLTDIKMDGTPKRKSTQPISTIITDTLKEYDGLLGQIDALGKALRDANMEDEGVVAVVNDGVSDTIAECFHILISIALSHNDSDMTKLVATRRIAFFKEREIPRMIAYSGGDEKNPRFLEIKTGIDIEILNYQDLLK